MKKIVCILAAAALFWGLSGCRQKEPEAIQAVDLRYRAESEYNLAATGAKAFTIVVTSSALWTVTSAHPDWCIISEEEGEASPADSVHVGRGTKTYVRVQYYDNTDLDDRTDKITIRSVDWVGKVITVNQKGVAFLTVPVDQLEQPVAKAGGEISFDVNSNQNWSAEVTSGNWISIKEGATGTGNGSVTVTAEENASELRYAEVTIYDRNKVPMATVHFTQDGVQLVPAAAFSFSLTRLLRSFAPLSNGVQLTISSAYAGPQPRKACSPVWAPSFSLAATQEIDFSFSSSGYLDVSVPRVPS